MRRLFRQFSTPGGIPSHVSVPTPGSIHEGGELGYVLTHAFGAAFDNPDLIVAAVVGDGEAETGPLAGSWKGTSFLNPARDGAVLPILHLNGYKIAGPTVLGRDSDEDVRALLAGQRLRGRISSRATIRRACTRRSPRRSTPATSGSARSSRTRAQHGVARARRAGRPSCCARRRAGPARRRWTACRSRAPSARTRCRWPTCAGEPEHLHDARSLDAQLPARRSCSTRTAGSSPELAALAPRGDRRMGANPHANGGKLLRRPGPARLPRLRARRSSSRPPSVHESTRQLGKMLRDIFTRNAEQANFRLFCPDETNSNRLGDVFEVENRCFVGTTLDIDDHVAPDGRVMEVLSEHLCEGWLEGYLLTGRHGLFATYEAFAMVSASMTVQHTKWLRGSDQAAVARADRLAQHPADLDLLAQRPQRLQPPGAGPDRRDAVQARHGGAHLPAARRQLPALGGRPLLPQPQLRQPDRDRQAAAAAVARHGRGDRALRARGVDLGVGQQRRRRASRTWCWPARATCRRWRRSPRPGGCASTCPS